MAEPPWFGDVEKLMIKCFLIAVGSSGAAQAREKDFPPWRVFVATMVYTGFATIGIIAIGVHFYGIEKSSFLIFTSTCTGLVTTKVMSAMYDQVAVSTVNFLWKKITGQELIKGVEDPNGCSTTYVQSNIQASTTVTTPEAQSPVNPMPSFPPNPMTAIVEEPKNDKHPG